MLADAVGRKGRAAVLAAWAARTAKKSVRSSSKPSTHVTKEFQTRIQHGNFNEVLTPVHYPPACICRAEIYLRGVDALPCVRWPAHITT